LLKKKSSFDEEKTHVVTSNQHLSGRKNDSKHPNLLVIEAKNTIFSVNMGVQNIAMFISSVTAPTALVAILR
jgi:hypothetical protein